ncbi:(2Fe-2S)-binding protein [Blastococcus sp. CT_GayMR16]|uniref:(2Fe-2S)-binding protein n=1 Tax=Blastococcus sp. CT_GayMR16 TaxID=2559607 RepID=UPI001FD804FE|nr:(2Fe-2S)-binding protein [Blastococcus sp. CT_GayMR16]
MTGELQATVAGRIPGAAALGLLAPPSVPLVPAVDLADPAWVTRAVRGGRTVERRVTATVWWYSVSTVLLTPALAGLVTGVPLSARLSDLAVAFRPDGLPVAAVSSGAGGDLGAELRETLTAVVPAVAAVGRMRERPLWAIATDSIANQLLALGRALGNVPAATAHAAPLAAAIGAPLPVPRYVDVAGARFTQRASCCLMVELPGGSLCTSCPHRLPAEREALLEQAARWF